MLTKGFWFLLIPASSASDVVINTTICSDTVDVHC